MNIFLNLWEDDQDNNKNTCNPDPPLTADSENRSPDDRIEVLQWTQPDVIDWITRIGYSDFIERFKDRGVDGELLLSLSEKNLRFSIGIESSLLQERFMREVTKLKQSTSFSSQDHTNLRSFLMSIDPEFSVYTYPMLKAGVDRNCLTLLSEYQLARECEITNSIHRRKILDAINDEKKLLERPMWETNTEKKFDGFISYRRSNGSEFASLLHLKLEHLGHSIFLDTECLGPGKFDNNLKQNIKRAKNFLLVLTQKSLDRCIGDDDCNDWVHKEIVTAIECNCNIIPIVDNFQWPDVGTLPEDMRIVARYKSITWEHDDADRSVRQVDKFMWGNDTESDAGRMERSASLSLQTGSSVDWWQGPVERIKSAPGTPANNRTSRFGRNTVKCPSNRRENCPTENSVVYRSESLPTLQSDVLDLTSRTNINQITEYTVNVLPSNIFKDDSKLEKCTDVEGATSQIEDTTNNTNNLRSNTVITFFKKLVPFTKINNKI